MKGNKTFLSLTASAFAKENIRASKYHDFWALQKKTGSITFRYPYKSENRNFGTKIIFLKHRSHIIILNIFICIYF